MTRLGDIAEIQAGLVTKAAGEGHGVPFLTMASLADLRAGKLSADALPRMEDDDDAADDGRYRLRPGDLLIPARTTGDYLEPAIAERGEEVGVPVNSTLLKVRARVGAVDPWWLYGFLGSEKGKARMLRGSSSGTAQLSLSAKSIAEMEIELPDIERQEKIGRLIRAAHDARRTGLRAADLRLRLAYAAVFQQDENGFKK